MSENKSIPRFIIALILALIAGAGNYWYLTKAKYETVLAYGSNVNKGDEISPANLTEIRFSFPAAADDRSLQAFRQTFLSPGKKEVLAGAKLNGSHKAGELARAADFETSNVEAADYRVFGNFRVVDVGDSTITIEIEATNGKLDAQTRRFIEISNYDPKVKGVSQIFGVVEHSSNAADESASNSSKSSLTVGNAREKLTVHLPPNCDLPASLNPKSRGQNVDLENKDVRVGFIVSASILSEDEFRASSSVSN